MNLFFVAKISNPIFYRRFADDTAAIFNNFQYFKHRLENSSILKFTHESMTNNIFLFLDVKFVDEFRNFNMSVYVKPTDKDCTQTTILISPMQAKN